MKLNARALSAFLANPTSESYGIVLYGPDEGLIREYSVQLQQTLTKAAPSDISLIELFQEDIVKDPCLLTDHTSNFDLLSSHKIILIRNATDKSTKLLKEILPNLSAECYLIIQASELSPSSSLRKWAESEKKIAALACYHDDMRTRMQYIQETLKKSSAPFPFASAQHIAEMLGNDRFITRQELEKLLLYVGEKNTPLSLAEIDDVIVSNADMNLDEAIMSYLPGQLAVCTAKLTEQMQSGVPVIMIIRAFIRHFKRVLLCHGYVGQQRCSLDQAMGQLKPKVFYKHTAAFKQHMQCWTEKACIRQLQFWCKLERSTKSGIAQNELLLTQGVCMALAHTKSHAASR